MSMSEGKVSKRRKYYTLKMVAPTEQAIENGKRPGESYKSSKKMDWAKNAKGCWEKGHS